MTEWQVKDWVEMSVERIGERIFFFNSSKYIIFNWNWFESTFDCCGFFTFGWGFIFLLFAFLLFDVLIYQTSNWWPSERQYMLGHVWNALTSLLLLSRAAPLYCDLQYFLLTCGIVRIYFFHIFVLKGDKEICTFPIHREFPGSPIFNHKKKIIKSCSCLRILLCGFMLFSLFC